MRGSTSTRVRVPLNLGSGRTAKGGGERLLVEEGGEHKTPTGLIFSGRTAGGDPGFEIDALLTLAFRDRTSGLGRSPVVNRFVFLASACAAKFLPLTYARTASPPMLRASKIIIATVAWLTAVAPGRRACS